jgi:hypothetical protein
VFAVSIVKRYLRKRKRFMPNPPVAVQLSDIQSRVAILETDICSSGLPVRQKAEALNHVEGLRKTLAITRVKPLVVNMSFQIF